MKSVSNYWQSEKYKAAELLLYLVLEQVHSYVLYSSNVEYSLCVRSPIQSHKILYGQYHYFYPSEEENIKVQKA